VILGLLGGAPGAEGYRASEDFGVGGGGIAIGLRLGRSGGRSIAGLIKIRPGRSPPPACGRQGGAEICSRVACVAAGVGLLRAHVGHSNSHLVSARSAVAG